MRNIQEDLKIGKREEKKTLILLNAGETMFGNVLQDEDPFARFDFVSEDEKYHIEHKWRPTTDLKTCRYDSLYFDRIKFKTYQELKKIDPEKRFYIIWNCSGERVWWEFKPYGWENEDGDCEMYYSKQYNQDRGRGFPQDTTMCNVFIEALHPFSEFFKKTKIEII